MNPFDKETLSTTLTTPKNALVKQHVQLFQIDELILLTQGAINFIVDKALEYKLGARGLRSLWTAGMSYV